MGQDWKFYWEDYICHVRVAGVLLRDGKLLVQKDGDVYSLPGGHLMIGERTEDTLVREFKEELGVEIACGRLLFTEEVFWDWAGKKAHELGYYYLVESKEELLWQASFVPMKDNPEILIGWMPVSELDTITLYPDCLKELLKNLPTAPMHFVRG